MSDPVTRPDLTLRVLDIPALVRRCVPVYESGVSGIEGCRGLLAPRVSNPTECVVRWEDRAAGMETGITGGTAVDMSHPFGRYHALLWLRERGHELRWADDEPEVLAWSVLSVARGGGPIVGIVAQRCWGSAGCPPGTTRYYMEREGDRAQIFYADVTRKTDERDAKIAEALAARYAIRNPDGLVLPELPKENA